MSKTVIMLLFKDVLYDSRVKKEAVTLAKEGFNVCIICLNEYNQELFLHERVEIVYINLKTKQMKTKLNNPSGHRALKIGRIPIIKLMKDFLNSLYFYRKAAHIAQKTKPNAIHAHDLNMLPYGVLLSMASKGHLVYDSHELYTEMNGRSTLEKKIGHVIEKLCIRYVDSVITVNSFIGDELKKRYNIDPETFYLVKNKPVPSKLNIQGDYFRERFTLSKSDVILLYQGGFSPNRGIEEILFAMTKLPNHFKLVLMGNGNFKIEMEKIIQSSNLNNRVYFHEMVPSEDLLSYSASADIGLILYKNTCLNNFLAAPNKMYEYLGAGIPVVASNFPAIKEEVEKKGLGLLCNPEDTNKIAKCILRVNESISQFKNKCQLYENDMLWDSTAGSLLECYQTLGVKNSENINHK